MHAYPEINNNTEHTKEETLQYKYSELYGIMQCSAVQCSALEWTWWARKICSQVQLLVFQMRIIESSPPLMSFSPVTSNDITPTRCADNSADEFMLRELHSHRGDIGWVSECFQVQSVEGVNIEYATAARWTDFKLCTLESTVRVF